MAEIVSDIIVTPATIFTAPVGEAVPDETVAYGAAWGGNWTKVGYTNAPLTLGYSFEVVEKEIEQSLARVGAVKSKEELVLNTSLAEFTADVLALMAGAGTKATTAAGASQHGFETLDLGGEFALDALAWGFEGYYYDQDGVEQPVRVFIHIGLADAGGEMEFGKAAQTGVPLSIKAAADMSQSQGSRLFQMLRVTEEPTS